MSATTSNLRGEIINLRPSGGSTVYKTGYRDARHDAAKLAATTDARINALEAENAALRAIFPRILTALGNGSACVPGCSVGFLEQIPQEVATTVAFLKEDASR